MWDTQAVIYQVHCNNTVTNLAISSANLTAVIGFNAPFLFKNARKSPCKINTELIFEKPTPKTNKLRAIFYKILLFIHNFIHHKIARKKIEETKIWHCNSK